MRGGGARSRGYSYFALQDPYCLTYNMHLPYTEVECPTRNNTKIVFLDCDGVISPIGGTLFSTSHMERLRRILIRTGAKIVLSSSWRVSEFGRSEVNKNLALHSMPYFLDCTPSLPGKPRALEILTWLDTHRERYSIVNFVALDDIDLKATAPDKSFFAKHAVCTNSTVGMTETDADAAIQLLSDENNIPRSVILLNKAGEY